MVLEVSVLAGNFLIAEDSFSPCNSEECLST